MLDCWHDNATLTPGEGFLLSERHASMIYTFTATKFDIVPIISWVCSQYSRVCNNVGSQVNIHICLISVFANLVKFLPKYFFSVFFWHLLFVCSHIFSTCVFSYLWHVQCQRDFFFSLLSISCSTIFRGHWLCFYYYTSFESYK